MAPDAAHALPWPPLRADLDIAPAEREGRPVFVVYDRERLMESALALAPAALAVAALFDGRRSSVDVAEELSRQAGVPVSEETVDRVGRQLAAARLLDTEEVAELRRRALERFKRNPARPSALAGSFPADGTALASLLGGFFLDAKGPGKAPSAKSPAAAPPVGAIAPHIDFQRGGPAYAWSYGALAECEPPDAVVALGVAHMSPPSPWTLTRKEYETPFGPMKVDAQLYEAVAGRLWYDPLADEWAHRQEHSLEFQALWLRYLWRERTPPWVPILTSTFERFTGDAAPSAAPAVEGAIAAIGRELARLGRGRRILVLAGVDLAHVGPRFGDALTLGPELERKVEQEDRRSLDLALRLDADAFYLSVAAAGRWRKVCGLSALYTGLRWMRDLGAGGGCGRLLSYGQAPDPLGGLVSFASAVFSRGGERPS